VFPQVIINRQKLSNNIQVIKRILDAQRVDVVAVTKAFGGDAEIAKVFTDNGVQILGDSRLENLKKLQGLPAKKMLLRLPAFSEIDSVIHYADVSLVSHEETVRRLSVSAVKQGRTHNVILMVDLGDMREGVYEDDLLCKVAGYITKLPNITLEGIGANFACVGAVLPSPEKMQHLEHLKYMLENSLDITLKTVSAGNSSSLKLVMDASDKVPFNQLRIGDAFILGRETSAGKLIEGAVEDCFTLHAEIIEKYKKPSVPSGNIGTDGFGNTPIFQDRGMRCRAICAIGKQDVDCDSIFPIDPRISVIGASSDHLILDIEGCVDSYQLGSIVTFRLGYSGILRAMTSTYVKANVNDLQVGCL